MGNQDSAVRFWTGDEEYIKAVLQLLQDNKLNFIWQFNRESEYNQDAQELDRYNKVMSHQVAKRYGEYDYKRTKWRPVILHKED